MTHGIWAVNAVWIGFLRSALDRNSGLASRRPAIALFSAACRVRVTPGDGDHGLSVTGDGVTQESGQKLIKHH